MARPVIAVPGEPAMNTAAVHHPTWAVAAAVTPRSLRNERDRKVDPEPEVRQRSFAGPAGRSLHMYACTPLPRDPHEASAGPHPNRYPRSTDRLLEPTSEDHGTSTRYGAACSHRCAAGLRSKDWREALSQANGLKIGHDPTTLDWLDYEFIGECALSVHVLQ